MDRPSLPPPDIPFSALPLSQEGPAYNAWGRFGSQDQIGTLNLLVPSTVAAAARSEIRCGARISLDWPLNKPMYPSFGRSGLKHTICRRGPEGRVVNDDVVEFNTQASSQWDGLRHYGESKLNTSVGLGSASMNAMKYLSIACVKCGLI